MCEWSWLVPKCGGGAGLGINLASEYYYGGYSGQSNYQTVNALQAYDGLGALGVIKLDGVKGQIQQPIINSNIVVSGYRGIGGIGAQAAQSLYNSGLLKQNTGGSYITSGIGNVNLINTGARLAGQAIVTGAVDNSLGSGIVQQNYQVTGINAAGSQLVSTGDVNAQAGYVAVAQKNLPGIANAQSSHSQSTIHIGSDNLIYDGNFGAKISGVGAVVQPYVVTQQQNLDGYRSSNAGSEY